MTQFKKCKIIALTTEKSSQIQRKNAFFPSSGLTKADIASIPKEGTLYFYRQPFKYENNKFWKSVFLYILSDEEIKEGDIYVIFNQKGEIHSWHKADSFITNEWKLKPYSNYCKKVIATTDPSLTIDIENYTEGTVTHASYRKPLPRPSDSFIKKYCELGGIDEVLVEYYEDGYKLKETEWGGWKKDLDNYQLFLKVAPDNTITIRSVNDSWSREEVINKIKKFNDEAMLIAGIASKVLNNDSLDKWIEENL